MNNLTNSAPFAVPLTVLSLLLLLIYPLGGILQADTLESQSAQRYLNNYLGDRDALTIQTLEGRQVYNHNHKNSLVPASTLKILTALAALHYLGPSYRFRTDCYIDQDDNLVVKGFGDPLFTSESILLLTAQMRKSVNTFNDLILDDAYFAQPIVIPGKARTTEPYDAPLGALVVNFNTVYFKQDRQGRYISAEDQTPLLSMVLPRVQKSGLSQGRITISHDPSFNLRYAGELMLYFFKQEGIGHSGRIRLNGRTSQQGSILLSYRSPYLLDHVVARLLEYSNNFIANQILLAIGAKVYGPPATLAKGLQAVVRLADRQLNLGGIRMAEGSGISRTNRLSASQMARVLEAFAPYRFLLRRDGPELYKTGTLNGIRTRAGYLETTQGQLYTYVIFLNTPGKTIPPVLKLVKKIVGHQ